MMEQTFHNGRGQWVMCPTCRQRTEYENIGFVNDGKTGVCDSVMPSSLEGHNISEVSMAVSGSYGTKVSHMIPFVVLTYDSRSPYYDLGHAKCCFVRFLVI